MINWNDSQREIIEHRRGNIMVSASAGSGKTAVMIERAAGIICEGTPLKRIVMLAFNESIAQEIKRKLADKLEEEIAAGREDLIEQLEDMPIASISTTDGFCNRLIKEYFQELGVAADYTVMDAAEGVSVLNSIIKETVDKAKQEGDEAVYTLFYKYGSQLNDVLYSIYQFVSVQPNREEWLEKTALELYCGDIDKSAIMPALRELIERNGRQALLAAEGYLNEFIGDEKRESQLSYMMDLVRSVMDKSRYEELRFATNSISFPTQVSKRGVDEEYAARYKTAFHILKDYLKWVNSLVAKPYEQVNDMVQSGKTVAETFVKLIAEINERFAEYKKRRNTLDFNDMSHYVIRLLSNDDIAQEIASRYDYAFIDEYQDTNYLQEYILARLTDRNLFMVGDSKQSIYRFRLAEPDIMLNKYDGMTEGRIEGKTVNLTQNFRSDSRVLDAVNRIFDRIMTRDFGGVDYALTDRLVKGAEYEHKEDTPACTITFFTDGEEKEKKETKRFGEDVYSVLSAERGADKLSLAVSEGEYIASVINGLIGTEIYDAKSKAWRKVKYSDIALLAQERSKNVKIILDTIEREGIRVDRSGLNKENRSEEAESIIEFLKAVDNRRDDISLTAAMLSYWGGFTNNDLKTIREKELYADTFYKAVENNRQNSAKIRAFYAMLDKIALMLSSYTIADTVKYLVYSSGYDKRVLALKDGRIRLQKLEQYIAALSAFGGTLSEYLASADSIKYEYSVTGEEYSEYYVQTSTVHKSKGLEYPIIFLIDSARKRNKGNDTAVQLHKDYGIAVKYFDEETLTRDRSLAFDVLQRLEDAAGLSEYMRLFYVALTRAKNRIFITGSKDKIDTDKFVMAYDVSSFADWIINAALQDGAVREMITVIPAKKKSAKRDTEINKLTAFKESKPFIDRYLDYEYPYKEASLTGIKHTVTEIIHKEVYEDRWSYTEDNDEYGGDKALRGTNYHLILENIHYEATTDESIRAEIERMIAEGILSEAEAEAVDIGEISAVLNSEIIALARKYKHYREKEFMLRAPASEIIKGSSVTDAILVQGAIDLIIDGDELIIVDFKKSSKSESALKDTYQEQLRIYAMAAEQALGRRVDKKFLYVIGRNTTIEID